MQNKRTNGRTVSKERVNIYMPKLTKNKIQDIQYAYRQATGDNVKLSEIVVTVFTVMSIEQIVEILKKK